MNSEPIIPNPCVFSINLLPTDPGEIYKTIKLLRNTATEIDHVSALQSNKQAKGIVTPLSGIINSSLKKVCFLPSSKMQLSVLYTKSKVKIIQKIIDQSLFCLFSPKFSCEFFIIDYIHTQTKTNYYTQGNLVSVKVIPQNQLSSKWLKTYIRHGRTRKLSQQYFQAYQRHLIQSIIPSSVRNFHLLAQYDQH